MARIDAQLRRLSITPGSRPESLADCKNQQRGWSREEFGEGGCDLFGCFCGLMVGGHVVGVVERDESLCQRLTDRGFAESGPGM